MLPRSFALSLLWLTFSLASSFATDPTEQKLWSTAPIHEISTGEILNSWIVNANTRYLQELDLSAEQTERMTQLRKDFYAIQKKDPKFALDVKRYEETRLKMHREQLDLLTPAQAQRFKEILLQDDLVSYLLGDLLSRELAMTPEQIAKLKAIRERTNTEITKLFQNVPGNEGFDTSKVLPQPTAKENLARQKAAQVRQQKQASLLATQKTQSLAVLTPMQKEQIKKLQGKMVPPPKRG